MKESAEIGDTRRAMFCRTASSSRLGFSSPCLGRLVFILIALVQGAAAGRGQEDEARDGFKLDELRAVVQTGIGRIDR